MKSLLYFNDTVSFTGIVSFIDSDGVEVIDSIVGIASVGVNVISGVIVNVFVGGISGASVGVNVEFLVSVFV